MALIAATVSCSATSCDDEGRADGSRPLMTDEAATKRLVTLYCPEEGDSLMFSYDADGRLQVIAEDWGWYTNTCEWQAGEVSLGGSDFFSLDGELVTTAPGGGRYGELHFSYDSDGKLQKVKPGSGFFARYYWEGDRLARLADDANIDYRLYYSGKSCKGYAPFLVPNMFIQTSLALAHPELFGFLTGQLPDSVCYHTYYTQRGATYYSYTLDDDGYLASATEYDGRDAPHPVTRYYTWELPTQRIPATYPPTRG